MSGYGTNKVLVLDDERLIRLTMGANLRRLGYDAVAVATVQEAVDLLTRDGCRTFRAVITDIMMDGMDGFMFRDIIRGLDATIPLFFMTALDPEEGGGFLKRILEDANSHYLPKSVKAEVLLNRVQNIVASRQVERFIQEQGEETRRALRLAAQVQRSLLPVRTVLDEESFYTTWSLPKEEVSGDLYEAAKQPDGSWLYVLGDVQGHGVSAALAMAAVQAHLKQLATRGGGRMRPHDVANRLQRFIRGALADVSYMTALICVYRPEEGVVDWISCGAPDLAVLDPSAGAGAREAQINPERRGGLPIGLVPETVYTPEDEVRTRLSPAAMCVAHTDGVLEISRDEESAEAMPEEERKGILDGLLLDGRVEGSTEAAPYKFATACAAMGYGCFGDDVTELVFGPRWHRDGMLSMVVAMNAESIDASAREIEAWGEKRGWDVVFSTRVQLVFEEKLMNLYEHGFDYRQRLREVASVRLVDRDDEVKLTVWDTGTPDPSMEVAAGSTDVAFDLANRQMSGGGRGRLMVRDMCEGIERNRYGVLNETTYHIPKAVAGTDGAEDAADGDGAAGA